MHRTCMPEARLCPAAAPAQHALASGRTPFNQPNQPAGVAIAVKVSLLTLSRSPRAGGAILRGPFCGFSPARAWLNTQLLCNVGQGALASEARARFGLRGSRPVWPQRLAPGANAPCIRRRAPEAAAPRPCSRPGKPARPGTPACRGQGRAAGPQSASRAAPSRAAHAAGAGEKAHGTGAGAAARGRPAAADNFARGRLVRHGRPGPRSAAGGRARGLLQPSRALLRGARV